jgi:hypothetical protein
MKKTEPVNQRERISRKGFRTRNAKLVALGHPDEFRSIRYGPERGQLTDPI